ncbi:transposase [Desulfitobacterium dehalogenans ATCC 51507]|uniref:Transposase n=1 Tax=Desulfitobacterium dehalogenans (strain ATCC 51507 / DSM 9161 / JW/IU-DC1) TaxID=756499 RepID=I4A3H7_DESDJ|nr:transposase [Desulfitobacterium dehalogenans ATCC 51507]
MAKFTVEEKLKAVKRYLYGKESQREISASIGVHNSNLQTWIKQYQFHGEKAFEKNYTSYTLEYKLDVLNYMNKQGTSIKQTAAIFNIPAPSTILKWKRQLETQGLDALELKKKGRPPMKKRNNNIEKNETPAEGSIKALQLENERLRMENAYLKKLNALVQNKKKSPNKTKFK